MSGLEIAGLVVGLVPVVQLGIDRYNRGLAVRETRQLARSFATQKVIYMNTIEEILSSVVSDSQLHGLLQDPNGKAWQNPTLSEKLANHLGGVYPAFKDTMIDIKEMMDEMQKLFTPVRLCYYPGLIEGVAEQGCVASGFRKSSQTYQEVSLQVKGRGRHREIEPQNQ